MSEVRIQDDLYEYVNGDWLKTAVIPDDRPTTGGFADLDQDVERILMADFKALASNEKTTDIESFEQAVKLYGKILDTEKRNAEGIQPVKELLDRIKGITSMEELNENAFDLSMQNVLLPFDYGVDADMSDATRNAFVITGPSIILPDTTYYSTETGNQLLSVYADMASRLLGYTDLSEEEKEQFVKDTLAFDELVSQKVKSQLEWADYVKNYNPMSVKEVSDYLAPFDFVGLLQDIYGENIPEEVVVYDPRVIKEFNGYFNKDTVALYLHWAYVKTLCSAASRLSEDMYEISTIYQRTLTGVKANPELEKRAYRVASGVFSEPVGMYYGRVYFGEEAKKDIISIVKSIIEAYKKRIEKNNFLQEATKQKAILKLSTIAIKMGYPDDVQDIYNQLKVEEKDSYYTTMTKIIRQKSLHALGKLTKPVDRTEWVMPGHMVNACYDPSRNDITFPAAILQKPFYSLNQSISENLGGIGAVIAHEISHAFDNNGAHFDENGNLFNWWTEEDLARFEDLTKQMIQQWDGIPYHNDKINGELVVSENIADNGGVAVTLQIMHETPGTDFKKYFINWAKVWCRKAKEEYIQLLLKSDVHSPAELRANMPVRNFDEWYEAFDVKETDGMYMDPDKRIVIW